MKYLKKLDEVNEGKKVESKHPIMPYFLAAKEFLKEKKIKDIMDSAMLDQEAYDGDVYFTIENLDGTFDMVQCEGRKIHVDQDLNGKGKKVIYPTIEEFKKKYNVAVNEGSEEDPDYAPLDKIAEKLAEKFKAEINDAVEKVKSKRPLGPYKAQYVLEEIIKIFEKAV